MLTIILALVVLLVLVLLIRFLGAWMLRIDEVIHELREIKKKLNER